MKNSPSNPDLDEGAPAAQGGVARAVPPGSQTLLRGLDVLDAVIDGPVTLGDLAARLGLTKSTTHRLANALVDRGFLTFTPRTGYQFGPKLLELGFRAQQQADVVQIARPHLEALAAASEDTVHLGVPDQDRALYLDKIPGRRRVDISSRVGDRQPLTSTGLGKALLLDDDAERWRTLFAAEDVGAPHAVEWPVWLDRMTGYVEAGRAFDMEENEDQIRCVAAPIRDASGRIVAAFSVSSAAQYMADERMAALGEEARAVAAAISHDLGWTGNIPAGRMPRRRQTP